MTEQQIPKEMKELRDEIISDITAALVSRDKEILRLREAASELLHLHLCEQEGLLSGTPTRQQWLEAVDKLSAILHPSNPIPVDGQEK